MAMVEVPHYCDCIHCTVEYDTINVKEGPITEQQHRLNSTIASIYSPILKQQLKEQSFFMKRINNGKEQAPAEES